MGGSNSTRKITVINDESSGVIKISDSVVSRLRGDLEGLSPPKGPKGDEIVTGPIAKPIVETKPREDGEGSREAPKPLDGHWQDKLKESERRQSQFQKISAEEFNVAVQEVESLFRRPDSHLVCEENQSRVQQCYEQNQHQSLKCSEEVKAFTNCVDALRLQAISKG